MDKPQVEKKPRNIFAQIGLGLMIVFLNASFIADIVYYFDLKHHSGHIPNLLIGDIIFMVLFLSMSVITWRHSFNNPVLWEEKKKLAIIVALLYFFYYLYFIGSKLSDRWDVDFGVFTLVMYAAIIPDGLLWWDIYGTKARADKYFAYLFSLKQLSLYEQRKLQAFNKEDSSKQEPNNQEV